MASATEKEELGDIVRESKEREEEMKRVFDILKKIEEDKEQKTMKTTEFKSYA